MLSQRQYMIKRFMPERPEGLPNWVWVGVVVVFLIYLFVSQVWPKISPFLKDTSAAFSAWKESRDNELEKKILEKQKERFKEAEDRINTDLDKRFEKFEETIDSIFITLKKVKSNDYEHAETSRNHTRQLERVEKSLQIATKNRESFAQATNENLKNLEKTTSNIEGQLKFISQFFLGGGKGGAE